MKKNLSAAAVLFLSAVMYSQVGINNTAPQATLDIIKGTGTVGAIKIADGTQGAGKVLMSDANGVGTWKTPNFTHVRKKYSNSATFSTNYTPLTDFGAFTSPYTGQYEVIFHSFLRVASGAGNTYQPRIFSFQVKNTHVVDPNTSPVTDVVTKTNQMVSFYAEIFGSLATAIPLIISSAAGDKVEFELKSEVGGPFEIVAGWSAPENSLDIFYLGAQ